MNSGLKKSAQAKDCGQYLIFAGEVHYSVGGGHDLISSKHDEKEALVFAEQLLNKTVTTIDTEQPEDDQNSYHDIEWSHVLDTKTGQIIAAFGQEPLGSRSKLSTIEGIEL